MVALLPRDDDQSIADDLSYRLIIVPWQGMGVSKGDDVEAAVASLVAI